MSVVYIKGGASEPVLVPAVTKTYTLVNPVTRFPNLGDRRNGDGSFVIEWSERNRGWSVSTAARTGYHYGTY